MMIFFSAAGAAVTAGVLGADAGEGGCGAGRFVAAGGVAFGFAADGRDGAGLVAADDGNRFEGDLFGLGPEHGAVGQREGGDGATEVTLAS